MADRDEILTTVIGMIRKTLLNQNIEIKPDDDLRSQLGLDSMGAIEIADKIESAYNIQLEDDDMKEIRTLNNTVDLILKKIAG